MKTRFLILFVIFQLIVSAFALLSFMFETQEFNPLKFMIPVVYYLFVTGIFVLIGIGIYLLSGFQKRRTGKKDMRK
ncbi:MAG: hypothetical protein K5798_02900 [Nitrosopumilus sp.]|uniref:hypothetical protein n=1 Tax=Nitrosopumilus sp. TaxID=2024843 RepID=UPI00242D0A84|nr:hypothetical protein [Nitrosopumilus sp.]MCV0366199.1 hypothetical protein [Nitrosopumilus sp.]